MNKMRKALVTGAAGQDGFYMCKFLLEKGYEVYAIDIKYEDDLQAPNLTHIAFNLTDTIRLGAFLKNLKFDEIYNFGGNSDNLAAFDNPLELLYANTVPVVMFLDYLKKNPSTKLFQASSSLVYGNYSDIDLIQRISTSKHPTTPYGSSKLYAENMINTYRKHFNVFAVIGRLYNHESVRRNMHFLLPKIVKGAVDIKNGKIDFLELGDLQAKRTWIHAKDVINVAYLSMQRNTPDDYIICGDSMHTVEEVVNYVFNKLNIPVSKVRTNTDLVNIKQENNYLGSNYWTKETLGWEIAYSLENILDELINFYDV